MKGIYERIRRISLHGLLLGLALLQTVPASAQRIKDLAFIEGMRDNQLIGYGIVVGLDGTGDQTAQAPFTAQSMASMLARMGVQLPPGQILQLKNVAAVSVTASLPPLAQNGQPLDVTVSSLGNAKSLRGGTLLLTPLKGSDGQTYALAQGNVIVAGAGASAGGGSVQQNHLAVGRVPQGATVERSLPQLPEPDVVNLVLGRADYATASAIEQAINRHWQKPHAHALSARSVQIRLPAVPSERVAFLAALEDLSVTAGRERAKVVINARTGSIVANQDVTLAPCAVAHGGLSVTIRSQPLVSQPAPLSGGRTVETEQAEVSIEAQPGKMVQLAGGARLHQVVKALNTLGATPQDLLAILQAMKAAGALQADLEII